MKNALKLMVLACVAMLHSSFQATDFVGRFIYSSNTTNGSITDSIYGFTFKPSNDENYYKGFSIVFNSSTQFATTVYVDQANHVHSGNNDIPINYNSASAESALTASCLLGISSNTPLNEDILSYVSIFGGTVDQSAKTITNPRLLVIHLNTDHFGPNILACAGK